MKKYIELEAAIKKIRDEGIYGEGHSDEERENNVIEMLECLPGADVVSRAAFDQVMWERDVAIQQLREDYGVGLGEKKAADVVERKRGAWEYRKVGGNCVRIYCTHCGVALGPPYRRTNFCPNCGADMRGNNHETDIEAQPTVDAVEVVRCGNCKFCMTHKAVPHCIKAFAQPEVGLMDFCSHGERRNPNDHP